MRRGKRILGWGLAGVAGLGLLMAGLSAWVYYQGMRYRCSAQTAPHAQTAIVLGCFVSVDGTVCPMLEDRVRTAVELYQAHRVDRLLMSGDHGQADYDEVNAMRRLAESLGVPPEHIFMDHAGFNTWDTMARARQVFCVQTALVVTQQFHLPRAVFLARAHGIEAWGIAADKRVYGAERYYDVRDAVSRCKALVQSWYNPEPRFLGPPLPITGDGRMTQG